MSIFDRKITRRELDSFLITQATKGKVLDVGSGGSDYGRFFPNRLTVDIDPLRKPDIVSSAEDMPFEDCSFDFILCTEMLEHVKNPFLVEQEFWRVLSPGGKLVLTTRFLFPIHDAPHDYWRFTSYGLRNIFSRWNVVLLREETRSFSAFGALLQRSVFQSKFYLNYLLKIILLILALVFDRSNFLIRKEFGNIKQTEELKNIFTTGYYIVCEKPLK